MTKRVFVSIDLPAETKEYLGRLARHDIYWIKWVKPDNFHITLNFLGDLGQERIDETKSILAELAANYQPFTIRLAEVTCSRDMLWLLPEENETLVQLQDDLKDRLKGARLGKRERRSYMPHILLARSKTGRHMRPVIENFAPREFTADKINLYESELTPGSATHRLIESFPLK